LSFKEREVILLRLKNLSQLKSAILLVSKVKEDKLLILDKGYRCYA
jgi:hypothetical protein